MPVCPECGIDVAEEGLCAEYKRDRQSAAKRGEKSSISRPPQIALLVAGGLLIFVAAFLIGRSFWIFDY